MYDDGLGVPQDYEQAVAWYRKAADQGYSVSQYNLGVMYAQGQGVQQDYVQAHMWFNLAAWRASDAKLRDLAVKNRNEVAANMMPDWIAEAQRMAREWAPKK
jgi:TPR repeat protein